MTLSIPTWWLVIWSVLALATLTWVAAEIAVWTEKRREERSSQTPTTEPHSHVHVMWEDVRDRLS